MQFEKAVQVLCDAEVDFVIIDGVSATFHGSARVTYDLDICYSRAALNLQRLAAALAPFHPRPRGFSDELPFVWDERTLRNGTVFKLRTDLGEIDLLAEVAGLGAYDEVKAGAIEARSFDRRVATLDLPSLIRAKRAAGREKDLSALPELESLLEAEEDSHHMTEIERIADQLRRSHEGVAWHGPSLRELLQGITAEQAAWKTDGLHSIWELVLHIAAWELAGARMVGGEAVGELAGEQDWPAAGEPSELRWSETIDQLDAAQAELAEAIRQCAPERLLETAPGKEYSIYVLLHGIVQHNLYHAGQIAILRKLAPPAVESRQHLA